MRDEIKKAFDAVQADAALTRGTKDFLAQRLYRRPARRRAARLAPVLACLALAAAGWGEYRFYFTPQLTVSIDVNPSLELGVNRLNRVISVEGFNSDGEALAQSLDLKYMDCTAALKELLSSQELTAYLSADELVSIAVVGGEGGAGQELLTFLQDETAGQKNIYCCSASYQEVAPAHELGLSYGKYRACLALQQLDPDLELEDVCHMTMRQIQDLTQELCEEEGSGENCETPSQAGGNASPQDDCEAGTQTAGQGYGGGHGQGRGHHSED